MGTPRAITNNSNSVIWRWDNTNPYGNNPPSVSTITYNLRFPGQYFDNETGLHYNIHRMYSPQLARHMQPDPIGVLGGMNDYSYTENNPLNAYDNNGLYTVSFGFNLGPGFQVAFGKDNISGRGFVDFKLGLGLGVTAKFDPLGGIPNSKPEDRCKSGFSIRDFAQLGKLSAGPLDTAIIDTKVGTNISAINGNLMFNEYGI